MAGLRHRAVGPILVSAGYYFGAQIGFALQSPNAPQSVLWLPNSILLSVLLLVPYRTWPIYLAAAFPAQMLVGWGADQPLLTLGLLFLTNCADAALGAFLVRKALRDAPFRFDSLESTLIFAAGASLATILLSFADASITVGTGWSDSSSAAFITRVRSNILTHLIVVPAIVDLSFVKWRAFRPRRVAEATAVALLLVAACVVAFSRPAASQAFPALINLPLPVLLWAAARFGPGGIGCASLLVAGVASWHALNGRGPFTSRPALEEVVSLQLFLLASAIPLLFLAAVTRERDLASAALRKSEAALRLSYERLRVLAGKLITAQDLERATIARDLHDDFNQQLAAVAIGLSHLRQQAASGPADLDGSLRTLHERTVALTEQVRAFSRDLHPAMITHVGLSAALRNHCDQVSQHQGIAVDFDGADHLGTIPRDTAICTFRIVQEGLRNVVAHAAAKNATVSVVRSGDSLQLTITDRGRGFEPESVTATGGLGLLSMEERARAAGGSFDIVAGVGQGTRLHVRLPLQQA